MIETDFLPPHLRKYVVEQNYEKYTPIDQAVWRYILRQLKSFLSVHAHECYLEGLAKSGIDSEQIPHIEAISAALQKFGWRAYPVSGFIPPAAFMELQSLGVLPIASDMRTLDHLLYTPAPDIVHEAAGHAPILINAEFAEYLRQYAQVAKKAIISKEDLDLYEAIRELSDIKENPASSAKDIEAAEKKLEQVSTSISHISEATELGRMNWWTAEYGLIGDLQSPKIFGAGLLSSVGESKWCLSKTVKKIPLSVDCIKQGYDITEPQPQLYVARDFKNLSEVLEQMAQQMSYRVGGLTGLKKAIEARTVNTAELNSGLQISGQIIEAVTTPNQQLAYLRLQGPSQLCLKDRQIPGHDHKYHAHGFGTPIGYLKARPDQCPSNFSEETWAQLGIKIGTTTSLEFMSGVVVEGKVSNRLVLNGKTVLLTWENATVKLADRILFAPEWGVFDMALGSSVVSVFGGAADREAFGETEDFVAKRVSLPDYSPEELRRQRQYGQIRDLRKNNIVSSALEQELESVLTVHDQEFPQDWLLRLEILELIYARAPKSKLRAKLEMDLQALSSKDEKTKNLIQDGLTLAESL